MFRKVFIILIVFSPLFFSLVVGYPIISDQDFTQRQKSTPIVTVSERCFQVGAFREFSDCYGLPGRIKGSMFINQVFKETNKISPAFSLILILSIAIFIAAGIALLI